MTSYAFGAESGAEEAPVESAPARATLFDQFRDIMNRPATDENKNVAFKVEGREGLSVEYSIELDYDILDRYLSKHRDKKGKINVIGLAYDILIFLNRGFRVNGEPVEIDGEPITFVHEVFLNFANNAASSRQGIKWLYGLDARIVTASQAVLEACGYGDEVQQDDEPDPTSRG